MLSVLYVYHSPHLVELPLATQMMERLEGSGDGGGKWEEVSAVIQM